MGGVGAFPPWVRFGSAPRRGVPRRPFQKAHRPEAVRSHYYNHQGPDGLGMLSATRRERSETLTAARHGGFACLLVDKPDLLIALPLDFWAKSPHIARHTLRYRLVLTDRLAGP